MEAGQVVERDGKKYLVVGKSFGTAQKFAPLDTIQVESEQINVERDGDGVRLTAWVPEVVGKAEGQPDTVDAVVRRAREHGILREKRRVGGELEYLPNEAGRPKTAYKALEGVYPDESKKLRYVVQVHFRGRSAHLDARFEYKGSEGHFLKGYTIMAQQPDAIKEPVTTLAEAKAALADPGNWKLNLSNGEIKPRRIRGGVVRRGDLRAVPKGVEIPADWLDVEGVTDKPDPGEPVPAGATANYPGVFVKVAEGTVEWGASKPWFSEFFLDGDWKGRWAFRLVKREGQKWYAPQTEEECEALKADILPPGVEEEGRTGAYWVLIQASPQPYVLSGEAIEEDWLPPEGTSALPAAVRKRVPPELRFWEQPRPQALESRKQLAEVEELGGTETKQAKAKFVLTKRLFKGQTVIRFGASTKVWDLYVDGWHLQLQTDPLEGDAAGVVVEGESVATDTDGKARDVFDLAVGDEVALKPGTDLNPTKETPAALEVVDAGDAVLLSEDKGLRKYQFKGKALKGGWLLRAEDEEDPEGLWLVSKSGGPKTKESEAMKEITVLVDEDELEADQSGDKSGDKPGGDKQAVPCFCEACGKAVMQLDGTPCERAKCPDCKGELRGATEAEAATLAAQMERAVASAVSASVGAQVKGEKAGRRVRGDKVELLAQLKEQLEGFVASFKKLLGWAQYEDEKPATTPLELWTQAGEKEVELSACTCFAFKAADGHPWWFQWTTNSFEDREGETFRQKAIEAFVNRREADDKKGEFWFWHVPGTKFGDVRWQATVGRFLAQAGPFDDTAVGRKFAQFFAEYPTGHPSVAPEGWGTSHGYLYSEKDREDRIYERFDIRESTVLPRGAASNPWSPMPQVMEVTMNEKQKAALLAIGGEDFVKMVAEEGERRTKDLEGLGISYKAQPEEGAEAEKAKAGKWSAKLAAVAKKVNDAGLRAELEKLCSEMDDSYPYPKPGRKDEPEAEAEGEKAKAKKRWAKLSKRLRAMADKAEDKDADELKALADELDKADAEEEEKAGKPASEEEYSKAGRKDEPLARAEVADALTAVVESLRAEIKAATEATAQAVVSQVAESLKPLAAEVKALARTDEAKVAEKAAATPAASLAEIMSSVIGSPETRVDAKDLGGPKEAEPRKAPGPTGISLLDDWITGADQQRPQ